MYVPNAYFNFRHRGRTYTKKEEKAYDVDKFKIAKRAVKDGCLN